MNLPDFFLYKGLNKKLLRFDRKTNDQRNTHKYETIHITIMDKQNIRSEKERMEELKERKENKELRATREAIYDALYEIRLNAEAISTRDLETRTYRLMNKLREIGGM